VIRAEWCERHSLSRPSVHWLVEHADPGDLHPIATALVMLRAPDGG
jgi:hypothetical protein